MFPLMGESSKALGQEIIDRGIETFLVTVDSNALDISYCGLKYTDKLIESLPNHVDPCGEDGEFHTLVTSAPCFKGKLDIELEGIEQGERFVHQRYRACIV